MYPDQKTSSSPRLDPFAAAVARRRPRHLLLLALATGLPVLVAAWLLSANAAHAEPSAAHASNHALVRVGHTKLGKTLVDAKGRTLYFLSADARAHGTSTCYAACAKAWPPVLTTALPKAGSGAKATLLGVAARADGTWQVTYAGHRLYLFYKDAKADQANGEELKGFGGPFCTAKLATRPCVWYAVSASGSPLAAAAAK